MNRAALPLPIGLTEIESQLGCGIVGVIPPAPEDCLIANKSGTPLVLSEPDTLAAVALADIANRVAEDLVAVMRLG